MSLNSSKWIRKISFCYTYYPLFLSDYSFRCKNHNLFDELEYLDSAYHTHEKTTCYSRYSKTPIQSLKTNKQLSNDSAIMVLLWKTLLGITSISKKMIYNGKWKAVYIFVLTNFQLIFGANDSILRFSTSNLCSNNPVWDIHMNALTN